jgi:hypothetical protein
MFDGLVKTVKIANGHGQGECIFQGKIGGLTIRDTSRMSRFMLAIGPTPNEVDCKAAFKRPPALKYWAVSPKLSKD